MYAAIRQGKARAGMAEQLAQTIKEGRDPDHQRLSRASRPTTLSMRRTTR